MKQRSGALRMPRQPCAPGCLPHVYPASTCSPGPRACACAPACCAAAHSCGRGCGLRAWLLPGRLNYTARTATAATAPQGVPQYCRCPPALPVPPRAPGSLPVAVLPAVTAWPAPATAIPRMALFAGGSYCPVWLPARPALLPRTHAPHREPIGRRRRGFPHGGTPWNGEAPRLPPAHGRTPSPTPPATSRPWLDLPAAHRCYAVLHCWRHAVFPQQRGELCGPSSWWCCRRHHEERVGPPGLHQVAPPLADQPGWRRQAWQAARLLPTATRHSAPEGGLAQEVRWTPPALWAGRHGCWPRQVPPPPDEPWAPRPTALAAWELCCQAKRDHTAQPQEGVAPGSGSCVLTAVRSWPAAGRRQVTMRRVPAAGQPRWWSAVRERRRGVWGCVAGAAAQGGQHRSHRQRRAPRRCRCRRPGDRWRPQPYLAPGAATAAGCEAATLSTLAPLAPLHSCPAAPAASTGAAEHRTVAAVSRPGQPHSRAR